MNLLRVFLQLSCVFACVLRRVRVPFLCIFKFLLMELLCILFCIWCVCLNMVRVSFCVFSMLFNACVGCFLHLLCVLWVCGCLDVCLCVCLVAYLVGCLGVC